ncbi:MAG TPA: ParB/RepB/Spo0J family partition protein, partial [Stellaceae bacterium]|nr:ParB/RepB/Spo0J family partition protein [Stellaceae bacterium]
MNATPTVRKIPLNQLVLSPTNVRKVPPRAAEDAELKASIRSRGLKQNLVVHRAAGDSDIHEVTAGGRRLKALQALAAEGVIAADYKVPCLVEAAGDALETSLMENTIRAAMHPADEFVAMAALIDAGSTVEAAAVRFGVPEQRVKQRLRLGKLAPELLDAYRDGSVSLDIIMAFTLGADHAAQLAVWHQVKDQHYLSAHSVRRLLTDSAVPLDSDLGAFVGTAAYEDAGGKVTRDLFSSEDEGFMDDAALVRRLAIEKLEAKAAELRGQWAWAKPVLDLDYGFRRQFGCVEPLPAEFPPEIAAELQVIEERLVQIEELAEDELPDEVMTEAAQLEERRDQLIETTEALAVFAPEDRAIAGCIVTIGDDGEFEIYQGLVDRSTQRVGGDAADPGSDGDEPGSAGTRRARTLTAAAINGSGCGAPTALSTAEEAIRKGCGFSQILVDDLKAHRLQIARAHLASDFEVAFDLALYSLGVDLLDRGYRERPLDIRATETPLRSSLNDLAGTPADRLLDAHRSALDASWLSLPPAQAFAALSALPPEAKQRLFAWCIAATLKGQLAVEDRPDPALEHAGERLAIPFADYWRPTAANYWGRVKKAHGLAVAKSVLGPRWARDHAVDKKPILAAGLETAFDPAANSACIGLDQATRDTAAAWLPPGFAYAAGMTPDQTAAAADDAAPIENDQGVKEPIEDDGAEFGELPA